MLVKLLATLKTERMTAWERQWFLVVVVVGFEANSTFKNIIHIYSSWLK